MTLIEQIVPEPVVTVDIFDDVGDVVLFPEERAHVAAAVAKRRLEFASVRHCAREALSRLGVECGPILPGPRGAPRWPAGVVGSMTHCDGYRAAAVALAGPVVSIGVDAEPHAPLPPEVLRLVALPSERTRLGELAANHPEVHWDRLLFCAKESVYKTWFPLTRAWLGFDQAEILIDAAGTFTARLLAPGPVVGGSELTEFSGRFLIRQGIAVTAIVVTQVRSGNAIHRAEFRRAGDPWPAAVPPRNGPAVERAG